MHTRQGFKILFLHAQILICAIPTSKSTFYMYVYVLLVKLLVHAYAWRLRAFSCMHIGLHIHKLEANFRYAFMCGDSYTFCFSDVCLTHMRQDFKFFYAIHKPWTIILHRPNLKVNFKYACISGDLYIFCFSCVCLKHKQSLNWFAPSKSWGQLYFSTCNDTYMFCLSCILLIHTPLIFEFSTYT